ncbi:iron-containing alcohol dehydrogenase [Rhizobiaceae bacterium BDR2-2]|uniref:Iron-containing alcohol dehydrogenase n=1 Tax=Ectorhizobium quercum TaxID=2965071 RepID=A0AAE3N120_9HYPH|nr:iron-containing alcohol dehydrogenase [Ectorhizobium quercum]MCX8998181.1 iron-containing alcohol dehydrogenase [Ectorhizobium quercum]
MAGQSFANAPVAGVHTLAYPLGGHFHVPHGLSNALVLPHVLCFNLPDAAHLYADIAAAAFPELVEGPSGQRAEASVASLETPSRTLNPPQRLRDVGIPRDALPPLARDAITSPQQPARNDRGLCPRHLRSRLLRRTGRRPPRCGERVAA